MDLINKTFLIVAIAALTGCTKATISSVNQSSYDPVQAPAIVNPVFDVVQVGGRMSVNLPDGGDMQINNEVTTGQIADVAKGFAFWDGIKSLGNNVADFFTSDRADSRAVDVANLSEKNRSTEALAEIERIPPPEIP